MLIQAGVADDVVARSENFGEEVLGNLAVAAIAGDLIHARRADDLGDVRVRMQALQLVAPRGERIEKAGLLEEPGGREVRSFLVTAARLTRTSFMPPYSVRSMRWR